MPTTAAPGATTRARAVRTERSFGALRVFMWGTFLLGARVGAERRLCRRSRQMMPGVYARPPEDKTECCRLRVPLMSRQAAERKAGR
ncbi:hypothetical protein GCM10010267_20300 [Streptomyces griseorubens]|nr:hypothetical protein GCM10010267_20300 [Streptomyces griseorubens]